MPDVAVILPSGDRTRDDSLQGLLQDLQRQTLVPREIEVVRGVAQRPRSQHGGGPHHLPYLVFVLDDDVRLGSDDVIEKLVAALDNPEVGLSGTSQVLPLDSTPFQRRCAQEISRSDSPVVEVLTDSDMVTSPMLRHPARRAGAAGRIPARYSGDQPNCAIAISQAGLRIVIVPQVWHYHNTVELESLVENGLSQRLLLGFCPQKHFPDTVLFNPEGHVDRFEARPSFVSRVTRRLGGLLGALVGRALGRIGL